MHENIHRFVEVSLALFLAHLLADFVFQSSKLVAEKKDGKPAAYFRHGASNAILALLLLAFAAPIDLRQLRCYAVLVTLTLVHLLVDRTKLALIGIGFLRDDVGAFVLDQTVHGATILAASLALVSMPLYQLLDGLALAPPVRERVLWVLVVYVAVMWGGGYLLRYLTKPLLRRTANDQKQKHDELENAGLYIGWLERFLVLTALLLSSPGTVGLILAAKSIARYPEFKTFQFAEYFLIGTLLSVSLGALGGLLLLYALNGAGHFGL